MNTLLDEKEKSLKTQFDAEQKAAISIEGQIAALQEQHQKKILNMARIQGAAALLKELKEKAPENNDPTTATTL